MQAARARHQRSPEGRLDHRDRQRAYRVRRRVTDQQPGAAGQLEHLEADDVYRHLEAPQELLHALKVGGNTDADERDRDLTRPTVRFGVEKLSHPRRQHPDVAELLQAGLELRAQLVGGEPGERRRIVERLMQSSGVQARPTLSSITTQRSRASMASRSSLPSSMGTCWPTIVSPPPMSFASAAIQASRCFSRPRWDRSIPYVPSADGSCVAESRGRPAIARSLPASGGWSVGSHGGRRLFHSETAIVEVLMERCSAEHLWLGRLSPVSPPYPFRDDFHHRKYR